MKKLLGKLLIFIMILVIAMCGFIVVCAFNKDVAQSAAQISRLIASQMKTPEEDTTTAAASVDNSSDTTVANSNTGTNQDNSTSPDSISNDYGNASEDSLVTDASTVSVTNEKTLSSLNDSQNTSGINSDVIDNATYNPNDSVITDEPSEQDDLADAVLPEPEVITLATPEQVQECLKDASMGSLGESYEFDKEFYPYYHILNDKCKRLYKQIFASAADLKTTFIPVTEAKPKEWQNALTCVIMDHPELFWLNHRSYTEYDYNNTVVKVQLYFFEELTDIPAAQQQYNECVEHILAGARELESDYEKELYIHDLLCAKLTYNAGPLNQSAYSSIVLNETVCAGYARGFQHLMQLLNIPTYYLSGWGGSSSKGGLHGWDMVKLNGKFYNVDVTWADFEPIYYAYFNKSDREFKQHRRMNESTYLPACKGGEFSKTPHEQN